MSENRPGRSGGTGGRGGAGEPEPSAGVQDVDGVPRYVRIAGAITMAQGAVAIVMAVILVIREAAGHKEAAISGYGTAAWFGIIFGGVLAGGAALWTGRRWGRAIAVVAQLLLLPVSYYLVTSGQAVFGVPLALIAIGVLVLLFMPSSVQWLANDYAPDAQPGDTGRPGQGRDRGRRPR
ncbi:hypothetical protein [Gordonia pseudamarae]|uniref:hypothetical protein n=2 Tax=Gordonia TaxID=2053 RepID=UPI003898E51C